MEPKRSKNFTEREKLLLVEIAKEFISTIDNKKTDGCSVEAKKLAWISLTNKYNAASETGSRTEKQLHSLYDNLKKKARKNISDDKSEIYKTGGGTFSPKTTTVDEKVVALITPQFVPLTNEFDSSAPYYNLSIEEPKVSCEAVQSQTSKDLLVICEGEAQSSPKVEYSRPISPIQAVENTPKLKKLCLTETKRKNINNLSAAIIKRKKQKQVNEDVIVNKKLEILEIQHQHELMKLEKTRILMDIDIEHKKIMLENAKLDLEFKKKNFNI